MTTQDQRIAEFRGWPRDCRHGNLTRSCPVCEYQSEIERLKAEKDAAVLDIEQLIGAASMLLRRCKRFSSAPACVNMRTAIDEAIRARKL